MESAGAWGEEEERRTLRAGQQEEREKEGSGETKAISHQEHGDGVTEAQQSGYTSYQSRTEPSVH